MPNKIKQKAIDYDNYYACYIGAEIQKEIDQGWKVKHMSSQLYSSYDYNGPAQHVVVTVVYERIDFNE